MNGFFGVLFKIPEGMVKVEDYMGVLFHVTYSGSNLNSRVKDLFSGWLAKYNVPLQQK